MTGLVIFLLFIMLDAVAGFFVVPFLLATCRCRFFVPPTVVVVTFIGDNNGDDGGDFVIGLSV
jgi:hypothetical protein